MTVDLLRRRWIIVTALLVLSVVVTGFVWAYKSVSIIADGKKIDITTLHIKPEEVLAQAGITMGYLDEYRLSTTKLTSGTTITVHRAVPVYLTYQGKTEIVITAKPTVGEAAVGLGITDPDVQIQPGKDTPVKADMAIRAITVTRKVVEKELPILFPVIRQPDATMEKGEEYIVEPGQDGRKVATQKITYADQIETGSETLAEKILQDPKPQIMRVGTRDTVDTSRGTMRFRRVEWMEATAYLPTDGDGQGITYTGIMARHGIVAVDPNYLPLGSRLYIPGYGMALAADTGGAIVGNKIDLCMEDESAAWRFGRRGVKVYVLD